jgi:dTDP-4-dehydrorhamnose reductase
MVHDLASGKAPQHPVLCTDGWWRRSERLLYPSFSCGRTAGHGPARRASAGKKHPVLITGATGTLGRAFARACEDRAIEYRLMTRGEMDIADAAGIEAALEAHEPWAVINAAGFVRVDDAEWAPAQCRRENAEGPATLAAECRKRSIGFMTFSSDLVFDGAKTTPYVESDPVSPLNEYGRSKADGEQRVLAAMPLALVIRTSAFFGPWDEHNIITRALQALAAGESFAVANDLVVSPTYVPDLVNAALDLLIDSESGIWHLANPGPVTWNELVIRAAELAGIDTRTLDARHSSELGLIAPRPRYSALASTRGMPLPSLDDALQRYTRERTEPVLEEVMA